MLNQDISRHSGPHYVGSSLSFMLWLVIPSEMVHRGTVRYATSQVTIGCFGVRTPGCAPHHFLHAPVSAYSPQPGCNSLPCRMPPAALTEASSSALSKACRRYHPRPPDVGYEYAQPACFMQVGPLALKHGGVTG